MAQENTQGEARIAVFQRKQVRRTLHNNEWWFVIADVVVALTDTADVKSYVRDMRKRDPELDKGWGNFSHPLSIQTSGGAQKLNCANTEGLFRIIQSPNLCRLPQETLRPCPAQMPLCSFPLGC